MAKPTRKRKHLRLHEYAWIGSFRESGLGHGSAHEFLSVSVDYRLSRNADAVDVLEIGVNARLGELFHGTQVAHPPLDLDQKTRFFCEVEINVSVPGYGNPQT